MDAKWRKPERTTDHGQATGKLYYLRLRVDCTLFCSPCQRQCELLPSPGVCHPLTFHILIFSSETAKPIDLKFGRKHLWKALYKECYSLGKSYLSFKQRRWFFKNQPIRKKNCLWWPCLLTDWDEMSNLYRKHSIDASYQVSGKITLA
jgi:hypothetical protein